jgi:hypothetical protein
MVSRVRQIATVVLFSALAFGVMVSILDGTDGERIVGALMITGAVAVALSLFVWRASKAAEAYRFTKPPTFSDILRIIHAIISADKGSR